MPLQLPLGPCKPQNHRLLALAQALKDIWFIQKSLSSSGGNGEVSVRSQKTQVPSPTTGWPEKCSPTSLRLAPRKTGRIPTPKMGWLWPTHRASWELNVTVWTEVLLKWRHDVNVGILTVLLSLTVNRGHCQSRSPGSRKGWGQEVQCAFWQRPFVIPWQLRINLRKGTGVF